MPTLRLTPSIAGATTTVDAVADSGLRTSIFYEFSGALTPHADGIGDAALLAFLPYAMRQGFSLRVEAPVDAGLLEQLDEAQDAWTRWRPDLFRHVDIDAPTVTPVALPPDRTAAAAFSGGLDATFALHAHKRGLIGRRGMDIRSGVLVHGFDVPLERPDRFEGARLHAAAILEHYGATLTVVRTDLRRLNVPWEQYHVFALASVLHLLKGRVSAGIVAADEVYEGEMLGWGSNAVSNPMMSGPSFPIRFTGGGTARTEKAAALATEKPVLANLRVCWEHPETAGNCGTCEKCTRTKLNFMANGVTDFPALGAPVTPEQVLRMRFRSEVVLGAFRNLSLYPWRDRPDIKAALDKLVARGVPREPLLKRNVAKYKRSMRKRGFWPSRGV